MPENDLKNLCGQNKKQNPNTKKPVKKLKYK